MEIFNELCEVDTLHSVNGARIFIDLVSLTFETKTIAFPESDSSIFFTCIPRTVCVEAT